jgi:cytochrome c oxidase subunit 4
VRGIPRRIWLSWAALIALLVATYALAYVPLGRASLPVALTIGVAKALIVLLIFMELTKARGILPAFAGVGFFFLAIMFTFSFADYTTRSVEPATQRGLDAIPAPVLPGP